MPGAKRSSAAGGAPAAAPAAAVRRNSPAAGGAPATASLGSAQQPAFGSLKRSAGSSSNIVKDWDKRKTAAGKDAFAAATKACVLMRKMPPEVVGYVTRACKLVKTEAGDVLFSQGDEPEAFYIIDSGRYRASIQASDGERVQLVRDYSAPGTLGSSDLMLECKRTVTITTVEAGAVWKLSRKVFDAKMKLAPAPMPSLVERLRAVPFFASLPREHLALLTRAVTTTTTTTKGGHRRHHHAPHPQRA